jgi:hypothetical protein
VANFLNGNEIATKLEEGFERRRQLKLKLKNEIFLQEGLPGLTDWRPFRDELTRDWAKEKPAGGRRELPQSACNSATDEWWRWALTNPVSASPFYGIAQAGLTVPYLFKEKKGEGGVPKVYMIGVSAFRTPDVRRIVITEKGIPLLIPIYNMAVAKEEDPRHDSPEELNEIVVNDLCGLYKLEVNYDNTPITGCAVLRNETLEIEYVPRDNVMGIPEERLGEENTINISHGGFYLMLNPASHAMSRGDHLLQFKANSVNYEVDARIHINILTN